MTIIPGFDINTSKGEVTLSLYSDLPVNLSPLAARHIANQLWEAADKAAHACDDPIVACPGGLTSVPPHRHVWKEVERFYSHVKDTMTIRSVCECTEARLEVIEGSNVKDRPFVVADPTRCNACAPDGYSGTLKGFRCELNAGHAGNHKNPYLNEWSS